MAGARDTVTTLGILVGGGPAPGINSVIGAATIEARNAGWRVVGIVDGFRWLAKGEIDRCHELEIAQVSRIHFKGGSILGIARDNPTKDPAQMRNVLAALERLRVDCLLTIGGDGTTYLATEVARAARGKLRVVHVPKTIDNDIPIPGGFSTFGFQTARHYGVAVVKSLMEDAHTSRRWYIVVTMGRKSGHLALGIGKAAGSTLTVIPEEYELGQTPLDQLVDVLEGSIIKRLAGGREDGVAVVAEGLAARLLPADLDRICNVAPDEFGQVRFSEIPFSRALANAVTARLERRGIELKIVPKDLGYELRAADPIPFDIDYTRDLGCGAVRCLLRGASEVMVTRTENRIVEVPLAEFRDQQTGRSRTRFVNTDADGYQVAASYQIRLRPEDLVDDAAASALAKAGRTTVADLRVRFGE
jgi:6-phosphofructokinase 1